MPEEFGTIKPVTQKQLELFASEVQHAEGANEESRYLMLKLRSVKWRRVWR